MTLIEIVDTGGKTQINFDLKCRPRARLCQFFPVTSRLSIWLCSEVADNALARLFLRQLVLGVVEYGMNGREAVDAARFHHQWMPDETTFESASILADAQAKLTKMGHTVRIGVKQGDGNSILIDPKTGAAFGVMDKRSPDGKASK